MKNDVTICDAPQTFKQWRMDARSFGGRGNQAGPSLTELIASVESLRNLAGNDGSVAGFKDVREIADSD